MKYKDSFQNYKSSQSIFQIALSLCMQKGIRVNIVVKVALAKITQELEKFIIRKSPKTIASKAVKSFTTSLFIFFLSTTNSQAIPTTSEILLSPLKVITKPLQWWLHGYENKVDEYKAEITYNLELDGKPLTITK